MPQITVAPLPQTHDFLVGKYIGYRLPTYPKLLAESWSGAAKSHQQMWDEMADFFKISHKISLTKRDNEIVIGHFAYHPQMRTFLSDCRVCRNTDGTDLSNGFSITENRALRDFYLSNYQPIIQTTCIQMIDDNPSRSAAASLDYHMNSGIYGFYFKDILQRGR